MLDFKKMSVEDIRLELVKLGMSLEEAEQIKGKTAVVEKYNEMNIESAELRVDPEELVNPIVVPTLTNVPDRYSPEWSDFVLSLFTDEEVCVDGKGNKAPNVNGLRRVAQVVLGQIVASVPSQVKFPSAGDPTAGCVYTVQFADNTVFAGAADCSPNNVDETYGIYPTAMAETRAEARALRKALGLKVVAVDELSDRKGWTEPEQQAGMIQDVQIRAIDNLCKKSDIDVMAFVNSGTLKYASIREITRETAGKMMENLNDMNREVLEIPISIKGYKANWKI